MVKIKAIERYPKISIALILSILLLYPPLYGLYYFGIQTVFGYFAHDAFYYLTVGKNSSFPYFSFDGEKTTNGFHPLWQYVVTAVFGLLRESTSETHLYVIFVIGTVLTTAGFIFAGWALFLKTRSPLLAVWLIPGPFYILYNVTLGNDAAHGVTYTYSPWAFMNGMESSSSIAAGGLFLYFLVKKYSNAELSDKSDSIYPITMTDCNLGFASLGLTLALIVLSRLDDIFLLITTTLFVFFTGKPRENIRATLFVALPTVIVLTAYMTFNYITCNSLLPISGMIKSSTAAALSGNISMSISDIFPPLHELIRPTYKLQEWGVTAVRSSAMMFPMIFCFWISIYLIANRTNNRELFQEFKWFFPILIYVVLKGVYNLVNVRLGSQGYWYYALTVLFTNYILIVFLHMMFSRAGRRSMPMLKWINIGVFISVYLFISAKIISTGSYADERYYPVWRDRMEITRALKSIDPSAKLIDRSDGAYAYSLDLPAVCSLGYAIDYDGYLALRNGKFLDYCMKRGFNTTFDVRSAYPLEKEDYTFHKIFEHPRSGTVFYRIEPKKLNSNAS